MLGSTEIIVLVVVIGVLIFGAKKIPQLAKTFGKAKGEFEKGKIEADKELQEFKDEVNTVTKNETNTVTKNETNTVTKNETNTVTKDKEIKSD
jgi:sec-independent protein translocase protein TatA